MSKKLGKKYYYSNLFITIQLNILQMLPRLLCDFSA